MRSLRCQSSPAQSPGAGRVAGARRNVLPPPPMPLLPAASAPPRSTRSHLHRLAAAPTSGIENSSAVSSSSPSSSSSSLEAPDRPAPAPLPPMGDIKPSGYSVADWAAAFDSQLEEFDYEISKKKRHSDRDNSDSPVAFIEGEIPPALRGGTLFRNGPARFERGGERYAHMLDGDGYVCRFGFSDDGERVEFRSRFVKTRELVAEEYADRILFRSTFGTARAGGPLANAFDFRLKNPANTHVVPWGGRLLALWEAGPPHELDPRSLETRPAPATLGGLVLPGSAPSTTGVSRELDERLGFGSASTAHPHVVPAPPGEADVWYGLRENGGAKEEGEEEREEGESGGRRREKKASSPPTTTTPTPAGSLASSFPSFSSSSSSPGSPPWPSPTSRLATWAWQSQMTVRGPSITIEVAEFDASWRRVAKAELTLPGAAFNPHDFAVSPRHYVFFQGATTFRMLPYVVGLKGPAQCVKIGTGKMVVHVAPRGQSHPQHARAVSIEADEGGFLIHHGACFEDARTGEIVVWSSGWAPGELERLAEAAAGSPSASAPSSSSAAAAGAEAEAEGSSTSSSRFPSLSSLFSRPSTKTDDSMLGSWKVVLAGDFDGIPHSSLQEHRIDLKRGRVTRRTLFDDQAMEHPKINPLLATRQPRFVYFTAARSLVPGKAAPPQAIVKLDAETGAVESWAPGRRCFCEEIVYVPVAGKEGEADKEDAGYLLAMVFDASRGASSLAILDAADVSKGPVARVWLKHHVPHGLHGEWCARGMVGF